MPGSDQSTNGDRKTQKHPIDKEGFPKVDLSR